MKKRLFGIVLGMCLVGAVGCGGEEKLPDGISQGMYDLGIKAVKVTDKYLNADLSLEEAYEELENISSQTSKTMDDSKEWDLSVSIDISSIESQLWSMKNPFGSDYTDQDIKESKQDLEELLGL